MKYVIDVSCASRCGKIRKNNEDNLYLRGKYLSEGGTDLWPPQGYTTELTSQEAMAVFDGMGGEENGEIASLTAAQTLRERLSRGEIRDSDLYPITNEMNAAVFRRGQELLTERMGTTMVTLVLSPGKAVFANLGDSPVFVHRGNGLFKLSKDHTDAEEMERRGITNRKPYLTQYLGIDPEELQIEPWVRRMQTQPGDRFLLCSDGLTDMVEESQINAILGAAASANEAVAALTNAALDNGGCDNVTMIVAIIR